MLDNFGSYLNHFGLFWTVRIVLNRFGQFDTFLLNRSLFDVVIFVVVFVVDLGALGDIPSSF